MISARLYGSGGTICLSVRGRATRGLDLRIKKSSRPFGSPKLAANRNLLGGEGLPMEEEDGTFQDEYLCIGQLGMLVRQNGKLNVILG